MEEWVATLLGTFGEGQRTPRSWYARGGDVRLLQGPQEFYDTLLEGVGRATRKISLAALYLGTGPKEEALMEAIHARMEEQPLLEVNILVDHSRGLRGKRNSATMATRLVSAFPGRAHVYLYQMPQAREPLSSCLPSPLNEVVGVLHLKCCIFDSDVIMSGANLSNDYFTDRMDRYMSVKGQGCPGLGEMYHRFVETIGSGAMKLQPSGKLQAASASGPRHSGSAARAKPGPGDEGSALKDSLTMRERLEALFMEASADAGAMEEGRGQGGGGDWDTVIFPSLQHPAMGIRWDEQMTYAVLRSRCGSLGIASAYLNLPPAFQRILIDRIPPAPPALSPEPPSPSQSPLLSWTTLLTAAPSSHGYATATGPKALIPKLYDSLLDDLLLTLQRRGEMEQRQLSILEYSREGWTFHCKGIWGWRARDDDSKEEVTAGQKEGREELQQPQQTGGRAASTLPPALKLPHVGATVLGPSLSMIGSSNMGRRSTDRDLESNFYVVTTNYQLRQQFQQEWEALADHAVAVDLKRPPLRKTNFVLRNIARYAKPLL